MFIKFALISVRMEKQKKNLTQVNKKPKTNNINSVDAILMINFYLSLSLQSSEVIQTESSEKKQKKQKIKSNGEATKKSSRVLPVHQITCKSQLIQTRPICQRVSQTCA